MIRYVCADHEGWVVGLVGDGVGWGWVGGGGGDKLSLCERWLRTGRTHTRTRHRFVRVVWGGQGASGGGAWGGWSGWGRTALGDWSARRSCVRAPPRPVPPASVASLPRRPVDVTASTAALSRTQNANKTHNFPRQLTTHNAPHSLLLLCE